MTEIDAFDFCDGVCGGLLRPGRELRQAPRRTVAGIGRPVAVRRTGGRQATRIGKVSRIIPHIRIQVNVVAIKPNRIALRKPPTSRIIISGAIISQPTRIRLSTGIAKGRNRRTRDGRLIPPSIKALRTIGRASRRRYRNDTAEPVLMIELRYGRGACPRLPQDRIITPWAMGGDRRLRRERGPD